MYLLDTPVVRQLGAVRSGQEDAGLVAWASDIARERLFISALTLAELGDAAARTARTNRAAGAALRQWIETQVVTAFDGNILSVDAAVARRRGELGIADMRDALFAATALEHGLTLVTRDPAAFKGARLKLFDPTGYRARDVDDDADWRSASRGGPQWLRNLFTRG